MKTVKHIASKRDEGKIFKLNPLTIGLGTFFSALVVISSIAQATDLQIYAAPTAGQKTLVMMLDTSGSMAFFEEDCQNRSSGTEKATSSVPYERNYCTGSDSRQRIYDRLTRLKDGMFAFLNSTNPSLNKVKVGLGNYSVGGDGRSGRILIAAKELGDVDSQHRKDLKAAIKDLKATGGTPTAHAFAEAAAYLMGTNTVSPAEIEVDVYKRESQTNYSCPSNRPWLYNEVCYQTRTGSGTWWSPYNYSGATIPPTITTITTYYRCNNLNTTDFDNRMQSCRSNGWTSLNSNQPSDWFDYDGDSNRRYKTETQLGANTDSGFRHAGDGLKDAAKLNYVSPLPAEADRQSCDGQGIYILSDGAANGTGSGTDSIPLIKAALGTYGSSFTCSGGLSDARDPTSNGKPWGGWHCMGEFAKKLFNKDTNPAKVSIQTAFVGFGNDMSDLSNGHVENSCKLSSRTQDDRTSNDRCSPNANSYATAKPGYGNGGFFIASDSNQITNSVIQFIDNLNKEPIDPLSTGAISVPVDALSPHTFQPYGYLRALEPKPGTQNIIWLGNLKKYNIAGGALKSSADFVFNTDGTFNKSSKDLWNKTANADGGAVDAGGVYSRVILPTVAVPTGFRPLFTDIASVANNGTITTISSKEGLFSVANSATDANALLNRFKSENLKNLALDIKVKLLNYFGYDLDLSTTTALPETLTAPNIPFNAMGASIHSFPVQMTYSGEIDNATGDLKLTRNQSVLYGSMEGAVRIVNSSTGEEQMVFVPTEILTDPVSSKALRRSESDKNGVTHGISGAWVVDSDYDTVSENTDSTLVSAKKMNVYGGMRMGGKSYYGLDVLKPKEPKLLFKVTGGTGDYARMGQTWSKPVLANVRYDGKIKRVMFVGGGYDMCYENPRFKFNTDNPTEYGGGCNKKVADGNAIYMIDAETGTRLWWASNTGANTNNANMVHSIVSRVSTLDRDGDGLVDHLYIGDLGGQVFRVDLNNSNGTSAAAFGTRVVRIADLNTGTDVNGVTIGAGDQPRFYQPPTLTVHDQTKLTTGDTDSKIGAFVVVGIASGDRSTPLDVTPAQGREAMLPFIALKDRPTNKVYGLIDRDVADKDLFTDTIKLKTQDISLAQLYANPQKITGKVSNAFFPYNQNDVNSKKHGWYRSLSSGPNGQEITETFITKIDGSKVRTARISGGLKAFEEEPIAVTGRLMIPVYDPDGTGITDTQNPCQPRVVGESDVQQFCLPFGVCIDENGNVDSNKDKNTGFQVKDGKNQNILGAGIRGITMGPTDPDNIDPNKKGVNCGALTVLGLQEGKGKWECNKILNPTRWYEKYVEAK